MKKRFSILMLILVMVFTMGIFTGCGQKEEAAPEEETATVDLTILKEQDDSMINTYTMIAVNPEAPFKDADGNAVADVAINTAGADAFIEYMLSEGFDACVAYGQEEYGDSLFYGLEDAPKYDGEIAEATDETKTIRLSTTTSVNDSGLLAAVVPAFEEKYGYTVEIQSAGTGEAIQAAKMGNADAILVHAKDKEEAFVEEGYARTLDGFDSPRLSFLYNYFVICGPSADPVGVKDAATAKDAFAAIAEQKATFISRGDGSGTHSKELKLWPEDLGITEDPASFEQYSDWYVSANAGMGACLVMAEEQGAYILTDKATFLTFVKNGGVVE